ncbi:MAG: c-type cytochrome [Planctomycetes bacterium]|nr:c-type cytochrome [Planctomycetota bacterium]
MSGSAAIALRSALGAMLLASLATGQPEGYLGPCALVASKDAKTLYVANADARQVFWVDLPEGTIRRRIELPTPPSGMALAPDGTKLVVTCAAPESLVVVLDAVSGEVKARIPAGHTAMGPAIAPDGKRLYVCNRFDDDVSVIDLAAGTHMARVKAIREPVAAAAAPDGKTVWVANHLPDARTDEPYAAPIAASLTVIETATNDTAEIRLPNGSHSLRGMCFSPDGAYLCATHLVSNFALVPTQVEMGWANINAISIVDAPARRLVNTVGLDEMFLGAGNPWGVAFAEDGRTICVSQAGTDELSIVGTSAALGTLVQLYISPLAGAIPDDPTRGIQRRRIELPGEGPRALAAAGSTVYIAEYFSDTIAVVDLRTGAGARPRSLALGVKPEWTPERRGESLFNDARICHQHWQSCASCHPDGRTDALNWDLMNDGIGNPKSTKSLILAHRTPPSMAEGVRPDAEAAVRAGIQHILFSDIPEEDARAIDDYLMSLEPIPSPHLVRGRLSAAAERGRKLFESPRAGCASCHPAPLYTDLEMHDVGTRSFYGTATTFDTPTLIEVWRSAPYLHDGRYRTMREVFAEGKHGLKTGGPDALTDDEIDDLVAFVLSL